MKTIKVKTVIFLLAICFAMLGAVALLSTQVNQLTTAHAHELSEIGTTQYNSTVIATIEDELQEYETSIVEILYKQRNTYIDKLCNASGDAQEIILAIIDTINETIAGFEGNTFILPSDSNFRKEPSGVSTFSFGMSPNCTCNWLNILVNSPCGHCQVFSQISFEVGAIAAGFEVRGWKLAAELLWFNRSNKTLDSHYTPDNGSIIATSPQITEIATNLSQELVAPSLQYSPGRANGLFVNTVEGDTYNSLGSFWYSKTGSSNGNVRISVLDRYDWVLGATGTGGVFNNTMVRAQEIGVVTPFYTNITVTVPGAAPFN